MKPAVLLLTAVLLFQAVVFHATPEFARRGIFFGVTVTPDFLSTSKARHTLRRYRGVVWIATLVALVLIGFGLTRQATLPILIGVLGQSVVSIFAWGNAHQRTRPFAAEVTGVRTAGLTVQPASIPGGILFAVGPLLLLAVAACYLQLNWEHIPDRFPVHWGLDGRPNRWATRSLAGVYGPLLIALFVDVVILFVSFQSVHRTRQVSLSGPAATSERRFKRTNSILQILIAYLVSVLIAGFATRPVWASQVQEMNTTMWVLVFLPLLLMTPIILILLRMGQGGTRLVKDAKDAEELPLGDKMPDECWRWGVIYHNPNDPALLVEKRMGIGWTFNFANKWSWFLLGILLVAPFLILWLLDAG
jgi:uncharacterized membrane protein